MELKNKIIHIVKNFGHYLSKIFVWLKTIIFILLYALQSFLKNKRIVAISLVEHIGDIVAAEPIIKHLRKTYPEAILLYIVRKDYYELVKYNPNIDKILKVNCLTDWILIPKIFFYKTYDLHISGKQCRICKISTWNKKHSSIDIHNYYEYGNLFEIFCKVSNIPVLNQKTELIIPDEVKTKVDKLNLPEKYIAIHCKSGEGERDWEIEKWTNLLNILYNKFSLPFIEIGEEKNINAKIDLTRLSILESSEIIKRSLFFIGIDSGPAHIANALNKNSFILMGKYKNFEEYQPFYLNETNKFNIIRAKSLKDINSEQVFNRICNYFSNSNTSYNSNISDLL